MTNRAIIVGSFDPIHFGHLNIINRSLNLFDEVIVALGINTSKKTLFSLEERVFLAKEAVNEALFPLQDCVHVVTYDTLTVDLAKQFGNCCLVRGVRTASDYEYEMNVGAINNKIAPSLETILLLADPQLSIVSSSTVKELSKFKYDVSKFVPKNIALALKEKFK